MFKVTFVNLSTDARTASQDLGSSRPKFIEREELAGLLAAFAELDPVQNYEAEPQIIVDGAEGRFSIHTGQKKLFLYNTRHIDTPALTLPIPELIAEIDGSAEEARRIQFASAAPFPPEELTLPYAPAKPATNAGPFSKLALGLGAAAAALAAFLAFLLVPLDEPAKLPAPAIITDPTEQFSARASVIGVYMTGAEPGHHGIAITVDGTLKLFQLNRNIAPSILFGSYDVGRRGPRLCLSTDQPGGAIEFLDHDTIVFSGMVFKRIQ